MRTTAVFNGVLLAAFASHTVAFQSSTLNRPLASKPTRRIDSQRFIFGKRGEEEDYERTYPEAKAATYELLPGSPIAFNSEDLVRPLLKQTQIEKRKLQVVFDAKKHGWDAQEFHKRVDGKGASVVLAKVRGQWVGGYNPRGWASLGGSRSSIASFLFYQKFPFQWQKLQVTRTGSMACGRDEFDQGIYFGSDSLIIPLQRGPKKKSVTSRLGYYFECGPENKSTLLNVAGEDVKCESLQVLSGVYAPGEIIPNSGGVSELGFY